MTVADVLLWGCAGVLGWVLGLRFLGPILKRKVSAVAGWAADETSKKKGGDENDSES